MCIRAIDTRTIYSFTIREVLIDNMNDALFFYKDTRIWLCIFEVYNILFGEIVLDSVSFL